MQTLAPRTRRDHRIAVERSIRRMRWLGLPITLLLVVLFRAPESVELAIGQVPFGLGLAGVLVATNVLSWRAETRHPASLRAVGMAELAIDTAVVLSVLAVFGADPTSRFWPLLVVPILEGAFRHGTAGAMWVWGVSTAGHVALEAWRLAGRANPGSFVSSWVYAAGILFIVATTAGSLAGRLRRERDRSEALAERLGHLAEVGTKLTMGTSLDEVLSEVLDTTLALTGATAGGTYVYEGADDWTLVHARGTRETDLGAREHVPAYTRLVGALTGPSIIELHGQLAERAKMVVPGTTDVLAIPLREGDELLGLILATDRRGVLSDPTPADRQTISLLALQASAAVANVRQHEHESQAIRELQAIDEMKDEFVGVLTHELRSPMTAMAGYADLLQTRWPELTDQQRDQFLAAMHRGTLRLARLVEDVLDASRAEHTDLPLRPRNIDVGEVLTQVAHEELATAESHTLELNIEEGLPEAHLDEDRVRQIFHNLVSNAVKYSPEGGRVRITLHQEVDQVRVDVQDDGLGIPTELQPHLFQKFTRLPTGRRIKGTGLGLYLTRVLAEAMGGRVGVHSEAGLGSTFSVWFPLRQRAATRERETNEIPSETNG